MHNVHRHGDEGSTFGTAGQASSDTRRQMHFYCGGQLTFLHFALGGFATEIDGELDSGLLPNHWSKRKYPKTPATNDWPAMQSQKARGLSWRSIVMGILEEPTTIDFELRIAVPEINSPMKKAAHRAKKISRCIGGVLKVVSGSDRDREYPGADASGKSKKPKKVPRDTNQRAGATVRISNCQVEVK